MLISSQQREFIKWLAGVAITVAVILFFAEVPLKQFLFEEMRGPASVPGPKSKGETLLQHEGQGHKAQGKGSGIVDVEIAGEVAGENSLNLEATVVAQSNQNDLRYAWLMPSEGGVTVATGTLEGTIGSLKEGEKATVRLSVNTSTKENRRIHLHVFKMMGTEAMGRMAQFNTVDQGKIDAHLQQKADVLSQSSQKSGEESQKIMQ